MSQPPTVPTWFKQRQAKADPAGTDTFRLTAPNLGEAFITIRKGENGRWAGALKSTADGPDVSRPKRNLRPREKPGARPSSCTGLRWWSEKGARQRPPLLRVWPTVWNVLFALVPMEETIIPKRAKPARSETCPTPRPTRPTENRSGASGLGRFGNRLLAMRAGRHGGILHMFKLSIAPILWSRHAAVN